MPFGAIVGHRHVVELLTRAITRGSLPPSVILAGPEGVGKRRVAVAIAQAFNCLKTGPTTEAPGQAFVDACGTCAACRRIAKGMHPDVLVVDEKGIHPEVLPFDVKETSTIIPVGVVRELIKVAGYRPYEGRRRVIIVDPADAMERPAQSALLKVLEETPPATAFVLVTARPDALMATIRSRCPQIRFGPLTVAEIAQVLVRELGLAEREARAAAVVADGSVARAIEAASEDSTDARSHALDLLQQAAAARERRPSPGRGVPGHDDARRRLLEAMKAIFEMDKRPGPAPAVERERVTLSLRALSSLLRDVAMIGARGPAAALANADLQADLERVAPSFGRERLMSAFAAVDQALAALGRNVNPKLVVDWLAFQI